MEADHTLEVLRAELDELQSELSAAHQTNAWLKSELRTLRAAQARAGGRVGPLIGALVVAVALGVWWLA